MVYTKHKEEKGLEKVREVVNDWRCDWQEFDQSNDDGIDGLIIMRRGHKKPTTTGSIIYVQVKCGNSYLDEKNDPKKIGVKLGAKHIETHRPRWNRMPGKVILIYRKSENSQKAWWIDLKDENSYSKTNKAVVHAPKSQVFNTAQKGVFLRLPGDQSRYQGLDAIHLNRQEEFIPKIGGRHGTLKKQAWQYYKQWKTECSGKEKCPINEIETVLINRTGWKHITRKERLPERVFQSWLLLATARKMITTCTRYFRLGGTHDVHDREGNILGVIDYIALRATASYTHKDSSVVQVVLKRYIPTSENQSGRSKVWFYSVHELRRGRRASLGV
ncbi:hypothetical protein CVH10_08720 [Halomonas sp. ND22Bw]|uniref:DUF4365 domain-containing protein n=1 Tax=Halomonas sp. ND22Bw TaxID=2054178 RepID=UPI000D0B416C|nr:hypothetical protein CVH10_08720 [Halomonas sp. ND22Bw]